MAATTFQSKDSGVVKSPRSPVHSQSVSPPWTSMVKGPMIMASDAVSPAFLSSVEGQTNNFTSDWCTPSMVPEIVTSPDDSGTEGQASGTGGGGSNASMKPVWNKPAEGVFEAVSPVMGAVSWPALGESSKSAMKSSSSESLKGLADGSLPPALQVVTENSSSSSHKQTTANTAPLASPQNHGAPAKQRPMKRGGGSFKANVSDNGGASVMPPTNQDLVTENLHNTSGKAGTMHMESSPRDNKHIEPVKGGFGSQSVNGNDRQHQRNTYRRSNSGPHLRGDGSYHHSHGGKRDQDREWNQHSRSFNGRDTRTHSQRGYTRGYIRPSVHTPPLFIPPQMPLMRPFGNNIMYPDMSSPVFYIQGSSPSTDSLRGMPPIVGPIPPPMYFVSDPMLHARIVSQIDYYFSNDNLVKDTYLRENMNEHGWVPISLIAGFKKVLYLTDNIQLILDAMRASAVVEVQGDKIRRRNDWIRWLMQPPSQAAGSQDVLASQLQGVSLDGATSTVQDSVRFQQSGGNVEDEKLII
ncbi:hypothetical protein R6Q57_001473 [Mikania cordata]